MYLGLYVGYQNLCDFLGVTSVKPPEGIADAVDGCIKQKQGGAGAKSNFHHCPRSSLLCLWLKSQIRKDRQEIGRTHIDRILGGQLLSIFDFLKI
jgi:hypothetical protein